MLQPTVRLLGIEEYRLPNGFRVVLAPDQAKPTFTINLTVLVGSIHEGAGEAGMAHVFEHLLFRGLEGFPDVKETFNAMGAQCNGTTWFDRTNFFATMSSSDENLETAIRLEAARLGQAVLTEEDLVKEGKIVESEFEMRTVHPQGLMMRGMLGCMFDFHAYSREPIGTIEDFRSVKMENVKAFYKRYYTPDNAVLFLTGKFDPAKALSLVEKHFGQKKPGQGRPAYTTREPGAQGERRYVVRAPGDTFQVMAGYRVPGASSPDMAAADALAGALSSYNMGPLHDALVGKGLASSAYIFALDLKMPSPWVAMAEVPREKDPDAAEAAIIEVVERGVASLSQADLDRSKSIVERYREEILNSPQELADKLSQFEAGGSWKLMIVRCEQIKALSLSDVKAFAARYIRRENRVVGRFEPDASAPVVLPDPEPGIDRYADLLSKIAADGTKSAKEFSYTPASLQAALTWVDVGPARIGLIPKEVKGDDVFIDLVMPFAGRAVVEPSYASGGALGALMTKRTRSLTKEALEKALADLNSHINAGVTQDGAVIAIHTKKNRMDTVLPLAWEMLRTPFIEAQELHDYVARKEGGLKSLKDNPQLLMGLELNHMLFPVGDPRRKKAADEQIEDLRRLTPESILAFHRDFFGPDGLVGSVVGDLSPNDVIRFLSPLTNGGWKAAKPPIEEPNDAVEGVAVASSTVPTPGKPTVFNVLLHPLAVSRRSPDSVPMEAVAWILFQDPLASRIPRKIREEAALSYAVQGQFSSDLNGTFSFALILTVTNPANAQKAIGLVRTLIEEALRDGFTADEVEAFKKSHKSRLAIARSDDQMVGAALVDLVRNRLDFGLWAKQDEELEALTARQVNDAMRRHFHLDKMGLIQIGDVA